MLPKKTVQMSALRSLSQKRSGVLVLYDRWLLLASIALMSIGLLMVATSSIVISEQIFSQGFYYFGRQLIHLLLGLVLAVMVSRVPIKYWQEHSAVLLLASLVLLILVLVPGIGRCVNGSTRWIGVGPVNVQISEVVKLFFIIYLAGYVARHHVAVQQKLTAFLKPLLLVGLIVLLLLRQPDFGAAVVILSMALGVLFLAGVRLWQFAILICAAGGTVAFLAISSPYRLARLTGFLNPWADQFDSGYQLVQSLIAFGRGGWTGAGLGESIQKLFYLPEAHTDFIFAVLAEELGVLGVAIVMALFMFLLWRAFLIGMRALEQEQYFAGFVAYGIALCLSLQTIINIGVNVGVLPTKGLTLPFMSYGGSSMVVVCLMIALLLRIDHETRWEKFGLGTIAYAK